MFDFGSYRGFLAFTTLDVIDLEKHAYTQPQVWKFMQRLVMSLVDSLPAVKADYDGVMSGIADQFICASSYGELLASVYTLLFEDESRSRDRKLSTQEMYHYITRYIDENYASQLSVQSACDEIGLSQTYLNCLSRKYSETTFNNYLMRRRMEAAAKLLQEKPNRLLRDGAACVGYEDSSYFSKVFQRYTGLLPSQYATSQK